MGAAPKNNNDLDADLAEATAADGAAAGSTGESSDALSRSTVNSLLGADPLNLKARIEKLGAGAKGSIRETILNFVAKDKFDIAARELRYHQQIKSDISVYHERTQRFYDHAEELILAVKNKKNFPNIDALPMAKRQEIYERVQEHFDDLVTILKRIEQIENDIKVQDSRSTVWVIQALVISSLVVMVWAVVVETYRNMGMSFDVVLGDISALLFKIVGL